jgi:hypothetical protein
MLLKVNIFIWNVSSILLLRKCGMLFLFLIVSAYLVNRSFFIVFPCLTLYVSLIALWIQIFLLNQVSSLLSEWAYGVTFLHLTDIILLLLPMGCEQKWQRQLKITADCEDISSLWFEIAECQKIKST